MASCSSNLCYYQHTWHRGTPEFKLFFFIKGPSYRKPAVEPGLPTTISAQDLKALIFPPSPVQAVTSNALLFLI